MDQDRSLDPNKSVYDIISEGHETIMLGKAEVNARAYCARFNFAGTDQQKKVKDISGGERNRVHLARMLKEGANLIILDEPTNDLDINTLRALEEGLESFAGCAVISSHDRWFLDRIATHIMAFEGDSKVVWFEGNYSEYEADRKKRLGKEADQPHRIRYRKLTRSVTRPPLWHRSFSLPVRQGLIGHYLIKTAPALGAAVGCAWHHQAGCRSDRCRAPDRRRSFTEAPGGHSLRGSQPDERLRARS